MLFSPKSIPTPQIGSRQVETAGESLSKYPAWQGHLKYRGLYLAAKNKIICREMDGTECHHVKQNKADVGREMSLFHPMYGMCV